MSIKCRVTVCNTYNVCAGQLLELLVTKKLSTLSGTAQKVVFNIMECVLDQGKCQLMSSQYAAVTVNWSRHKSHHSHSHLF